MANKAAKAKTGAGAKAGAGAPRDGPDAPPELVVAVSSRALFDLDESHELFESKGFEAYRQHQLSNEERPLHPGRAFDLVRKLEQVHGRVAERGGSVEVILLSRNSSDTGMRVFNSIGHHGLDINKAAFSSGESPHEYARAFGVHLFLSSNPEDVERALDHGTAATLLLEHASGHAIEGAAGEGAVGEGNGGAAEGGEAGKAQGPGDGGAGQAGGAAQFRLESAPRAETELRIAFDGDAVIFSDDAQQVYDDRGLEGFLEHELGAAGLPMAPGPFRPFLDRLHALQRLWRDDEQTPIRTALITARQAPAHERVVHTLRSWGVRIDEVIFVGGRDKGPFLQAFGADAFFDDQFGNCDAARRHGVLGGHVPRRNRSGELRLGDEG